MDLLFSIKFCWLRGQGSLANLYIIGVIVVQIYADYFLSNFVEYFGDVLEFGPAYAASIINIRDGLAGAFGVIGALIVDTYLTHYGMTFLSSAIYAIGLGLITYGDSKNGAIRKYFVLGGFFLTGAGKFSLRNSISLLSEENEVKGGYLNSNNSFIRLTKFVIGNDNRVWRWLEFHSHTVLMVFIRYGTKILVIAVSTGINQTLDHTVAVEKWWHGKFLIPTIGSALVPFVSLCYRKSYVKPTGERGSPLKNVIRVFVAAIFKRHHPLHENYTEEVLYEENTENQLKHTNGLRFLDRAAIVDSIQQEQARRQWRLCTVTEVEETKRLLHMLPMCLTFLAYGMVMSIGNTFFFQQGNYMDSTLGGSNLDLPMQTLLFIGDISSSGIKELYILIISKKISNFGKKYTSSLRYAIGLVLATFCCTVAAWIANDKGQTDKSVFWLTPQFILYGAMRGITGDGIKAFFHEQLPPSMIRYGSVFTDAITGAGAIFSVALVSASNYFPRTKEARGHTGTTFDLGHLSRYYRLVTVVCFVILSVYAFIATRFPYVDNQEIQSSEGHREVEP